jgi:hypothetical protein
MKALEVIASLKKTWQNFAAINDWAVTSILIEMVVVMMTVPATVVMTATATTTTVATINNNNIFINVCAQHA